ncbi:glycosyltransferase [Peribacillus simplex]|uniref:glycosyltransferase n=1 Tax=Peribacillus simplex TaxID=1478 RepID=UPI003CEC0191
MNDNVKNSKLFTLIIFAYNAQDRIREVIESVLKQEYLDSYVEDILIIDNNSLDDTAEIIKFYQQKHKLIRYIFEGKQGLSNARLTGIKNTSTPWVVFIDDDNILETNWISEAYKFITKNQDVGAFNGSVIPEFTEKLTDLEKDRLEIALESLACTHLSRESINFENYNHPYDLPFGAGLVIKKSPLDNLINAGWLSLEGRKGDSLSSGEDSEMCLFIKNEGYSYGYNPKMIINHKISKKRLEESYLKRLAGGISNSCYELYEKDEPKIKVIAFTFLKLSIRYLQYIFSYKYKKRFKYSLSVERQRSKLKYVFKS